MLFRSETICWEYGIKTYDEINPQGTIDVQVYNTHNNDYIKLESVDFGDLGASTFTASVKNVAEDANASIELYIKDNDSIEGINSLMVTDSDKIGTLSLKNASGSDWNERTTFLTKKVTGVHDLYLVFKGDYEKPEAEQDPSSVISEDDTGMFHFDYWKFGEIEPPATPTPIPTVTTAPSPTAPSLNTTEPSVTPKVELKLTKGNIRSIKNNKSKKITLTLKKIKNAVGYEVTLATKSNFKTGRIKKTTKSTSITFSKCKKGKTYYARVRGYYVNESGKKKYGAYSGVKKIKVNK